MGEEFRASLEKRVPRGDRGPHHRPGARQCSIERTLGPMVIAPAALAGIIALVAGGLVVDLLRKMVLNNNALAANRPELLLCLVVGVMIGLSTCKLGHVVAVVVSASRPDERDRLLVQYHDALREILGGPPEPDDATIGQSAAQDGVQPVAPTDRQPESSDAKDS